MFDWNSKTVGFTKNKALFYYANKNVLFIMKEIINLFTLGNM